jgi:thiamine pyrophosphokinase
MINVKAFAWPLGSLLIIVFVGCSEKLPECASEPTKDTIVKILREQSEKKDGRWYLQASFESIVTAEKSDKATKCNSHLVLRASPYFGNYSEKISLVYTVSKNEVQPDTNTVQLFADFNEVHRINYAARMLQENFNYKKFNLEFLSSDFYANLKQQAEKDGEAEAEKLSALGALGGSDKFLMNVVAAAKNTASMKKLIEYYDPEKVIKQLDDEGWQKLDTKDAGYTWAYRKDQRYTLLINVKKYTVKGLGFMGSDASVTLVDPDKTTLLEGQ